VCLRVVHHRRELQKIGVIYVKRGQEDQNTILRNDKASRSPLFSEFIHALGWTVPVANHLGYTGGLDRLNRTTGAPRLLLLIHIYIYLTAGG
jgi:hypothetical protein